jgi:hypothetical protein
MNGSKEVFNNVHFLSLVVWVIELMGIDQRRQVTPIREIRNACTTLNTRRK